MPAEDPEQQRVDVEQAGHDHQRQEARHDEVLDRVDAEHLQRVELLAHLARAEVGGDRRARHAGDARSRSRSGRSRGPRRARRSRRGGRARRRSSGSSPPAARARRSRCRPSRSSSGNQHSRSANRNCETNSPPYGYGGRRADQIVLPVRIIMSPNSSSRFRAGTNARSATLRTISAYPSSGCRSVVAANSTRCAPGAPRASAAAIHVHGRNGRDDAQQPLVSCRHREGTESLRGCCSSARCSALLAQRLRRRHANRRHGEAGAATRCASSTATLPRQAGGRASRRN